MSLTVGSLFSGIGGLDLGLERAGLRVIWQSEIDPFARRVLRKHWPDIPCYEDVRLIDGSVERPDLLCGGFPCQDISGAGKRVGIDGERSGLWSEFVRAIRLLRPRIVLVENVPALLIRGLDRVLGDLATFGFDAEWDCIPAAAVGAPHYRDRTFILAYAGSKYGPILGQSHHACDGMEELGEDWQKEERNANRYVSTLVPGIHNRTPENWWKTQSRMDRSAHGVPSRVDRIRTLGNAVVPQVAEFIGRRILAAIELHDP